MIKINLMIKPPPRVSWLRVAAITLISGVAGLVAVAAIGWTADLVRLNRELADTRVLLSDYQRLEKQLPGLQARLAETESIRTALARVGRNQSFSQAEILQTLLVAPPGVSITEVAFSGPDAVVTGQSTTLAGAMQYLGQLRAAPAVLGVEERSLKTAASGVTSFTFAAQVRQEAPAAKPEEAKKR